MDNYVDNYNQNGCLLENLGKNFIFSGKRKTVIETLYQMMPRIKMVILGIR